MTTSGQQTSAPSGTSSAELHLRDHFQQVSALHMRRMFDEDHERFSRFSMQFDGLLFDYSKNRITDKTLPLLFALAREKQLEHWRERMFAGKKINFTEDRSVLHTALRNRSERPVLCNGRDVMPDVRRELAHMADLTRQVHSKAWLGYSGLPITDVVNIGIGGSDLGPKMVCEALRPYAQNGIKVYFVSNVDAEQLQQTLAGLNPETTLFVVVSKTFTTAETLANALAARQWLTQHYGSDDATSRHFVAVSGNRQAVADFGIETDNLFVMWDWVGGRYSVWSAVGLSVMLLIGVDHFNAMLEGGHAMDRHFLQRPLEENMPVIMALMAYWYRQYFNTGSELVLPYDYVLRRFPSYLQQASMESNGKSVDRQGRRADYNTAGVLWGDSGTNGQHSFYQLLHQGTEMIPVDFIASIQTSSPGRDQHDILIANVIAQSEALMRGRNEQETRERLTGQGYSSKTVELRLPHMVFAGNRPSNTLFLDTLSPYILGMLMALYEHRTFVLGVLWNINSFDQWGVELGKQMAGKVLSQLHTEDEVSNHDASTNALINRYRLRSLPEGG